MVYKGPSRACKRCRQMKKKCGQERPSCQRCRDAGVTCTGYQNELDMMHRSDGEETRLRALRPHISEVGLSISESSFSISPKNPESPARYSNFMSRSVDEIEESSRREIAACRTSPQLELNIISPSTRSNDMVTFFFEQWVVPAKLCGWPGWLQELPEKYAASSENACFRPALFAASYAILAKKQNNEQYEDAARAFYVSALKAISKALKNNKFGDGTMIAIALLDIFQFIMDESVDAYGSHLNGLKTLLQIEQNNTRKQYACSKKSLFEFLPQMQTLLHTLRMGHAPSDETIKWVADLDHNQGGSRVAHTIVQFAQICSEATELCTIIRQNQASRREDFESQVEATELMSIIRIAEAVDENGENWKNCKQNPQKWQIKRMTTPLNPAFKNHNAIFSLYSFDCYQDLWAACVWNTYRAARIVLRDTISECVEVLAASGIGSESLSNSNFKSSVLIEAMIQDIRASVPFVLGQVDSLGNVQTEGDSTALSGQSLLWPMNIIHKTKHADASHNIWASEVLVEIGRRTGLMRAMALAKRTPSMEGNIMW